jgi:DNA-binding CsgD family transcriptional regulator
LTPREKEVLALAAQGLNRPQIAEQLGLQLLTIGTHLKNIHRKLGVHNRAAVLALAWGQGLLKDSSKLAALATGVGPGLKFCSSCGTAFQVESIRAQYTAAVRLASREVKASSAPHSSARLAAGRIPTK